MNSPQGLNGFILLLLSGTDARRKIKRYHRTGDLIKELQNKGYRFVSIQEMLK